jgi:hypothetical protein
MRQRVPSRSWYSPGRPGRRPRVLIEDAHPALAISDFSRFTQAGFDVAYCSGPGPAGRSCPALRGQRCALLAGADIVLHGLGPDRRVAAAIRRQRPGVTVLAEPGRAGGGSAEPLPDGWLPIAPGCSVPGQLDALRRALARTR